MQLNDRELLAKTLQAEAGNQGIGGMLAVGSVIRNRMGQGGSLSDVILAPAQFSAWNKVTGAVGGEQGQDMAAIKPSEDAYAAADAILSGNAPDITGGATHYYNPSISNPAWGKDKAGGDWTKIGAHIFGKAGDFRTGAAKMNGNQNQQAQMFQEQQPQQQSQGLLGGILGGQGIGGALGLSDDFRDRLKMGILLGSDPRAFAPMVAGIQARGKERRAEAKAQKDTNKTLEFLKQKAETGDSLAAQYYEAVSTGTIKAGAAIANYLKDSQATPKTYQYQALAKDLLDKGLAKTEAEALQMALSQTKAGTTVHVGAQGEKLPPPPSGYVYRYNDDRTVKLDDQGVPMVVPLSGGPKDEAKTEEAKEQSKKTMTGTILQEAQKARDLIGPYSTGFGSLLSGLPTTDARQLEAHVSSLKAQATIETLNAMRQQSPTGGALGNVTNAENKMLAAKAGALDPASGADAFRQQLDDYELTLLQIVHGNDAGSKIFKESRSAQPSPSSQPRTDDDLMKKYGGQ